jgi:hypothetical protein
LTKVSRRENYVAVNAASVTLRDTESPWEDMMTDELKSLVEAAKRVKPTAADREAQRRSFAFGNTAFENSRITREMIDIEAEKLAAERRNDDGR